MVSQSFQSGRNRTFSTRLREGREEGQGSVGEGGEKRVGTMIKNIDCSLAVATEDSLCPFAAGCNERESFNKISRHVHDTLIFPENLYSRVLSRDYRILVGRAVKNFERKITAGREKTVKTKKKKVLTGRKKNAKMLEAECEKKSRRKDWF